MNDFRAMLNDRFHMTVFITGHQYVTVLHRNVLLEEILDEVNSYVEDGLKKPFVIVSQSVLSESHFQYIRDNDLADIVLEN